eukprot:2800347-Prymnesium_polylepis.1
MRTDVRHHPSAALVCARRRRKHGPAPIGQRPRIVGRRGVTAVMFSWSLYQPITMRTTIYTHGTGREESTRVR